MSLSIRTLVLLYQRSIFMTSFDLVYFLTPKTATLEIRVSTDEFWECTPTAGVVQVEIFVY